jgi:hypothetical protein
LIFGLLIVAYFIGLVIYLVNTQQTVWYEVLLGLGILGIAVSLFSFGFKIFAPNIKSKIKGDYVQEFISHIEKLKKSI